VHTNADAIKQQAVKIFALAQNVEAIIVDDVESIQIHLKKLFGRFFPIVHVCSDGEEAWSVYLERKEAGSDLLIFTDWDMPNMNGGVLTTLIKKHDPSQQVIMFSGRAGMTQLGEAIEAGIDHFIPKPIDMEKLMVLLERSLKTINADQKAEANRLMALQLLKEQDEFIKNAIHEMHTPLSVIVGYLSMMKMQHVPKELTTPVEAAVRTIQNSYTDMAYILQESRPESEKPRQCDLLAIVEERLEYFRPIAESSEVHVVLSHGCPEPDAFMFPETKLLRIIDNTISNAIKYAAVDSTVQVRVCEKEGGAEFAATNFGNVIRDTEKVFERFYREEKHKGGYGLGLNIVGKICRKEGVEVAVTSTQENGTTFAYHFPAKGVAS
jgi:signal transduction histidine kinase